MLPDLAHLVAGFELFASRNHLSPACDERAIAAALEEASRLAEGHEANEPAALFHALARRPRAFGKEHGRVVAHVALEHARGLGLGLTADLAVLELMRARIARGAIDFAELRDWFRKVSIPMVRKPWPPT